MIASKCCEPADVWTGEQRPYLSDIVGAAANRVSISSNEQRSGVQAVERVSHHRALTAMRGCRLTSLFSGQPAELRAEWKRAKALAAALQPAAPLLAWPVPAAQPCMGLGIDISPRLAPELGRLLGLTSTTAGQM